MLFAVGVIPARYGSSRLPGKPLVDLQGKPLLYHVYHRAQRARSLDRILIATDDERIVRAAQQFGATALMTRGDHRSGTDRIGEAVDTIPAEIIVNIQGDAPLIDVSAIDSVVELLKNDPDADMATLKAAIKDGEELKNPSVVKVVTDEKDYALYFSRAPIPYAGPQQPINEAFRHIGLYAYRREFLMQFVQWQPSRLELIEDLEQLRALEHGAKIKVGVSTSRAVSIDTPEDLRRVRKLLETDSTLLET